MRSCRTWALCSIGSSRWFGAITVDVFDDEYDEAGIPRTVAPIDPFGYDRLPGDAYPTGLYFDIDGTSQVGMAHIWPAAQSGRPQFRLSGRPGTLAQGFYFYRADRLLQIGGWNTLTVNRPELEYARIAIHRPDGCARGTHHHQPREGRSRTRRRHEAGLLEASVGADRGSFAEFLAAAEGLRKESRKYTRRPVELVEPGRGFGPDVREAFEGTVERSDVESVDIRWRVERSEAPLTVDLERRTIWLNEEYRDVIAGRSSLDAEDAPFVKTLLLIAYSKYFEGSHLGSREKTELVAWEQLLTAALREELARQAREIEERDD